MDCSQAVLTLFLLVPCGEPAGEAPEDALSRGTAPPALVEPAKATAPVDMARSVAEPAVRVGDAPPSPGGSEAAAADETPAPHPG